MKTQSTIENKEKIVLRFFIEYGAGCLWPGNDEARKYNLGCFNEAIYDLEGNVLEEATITLPEQIEKENNRLIELYWESFNQENPTGPSLWDEKQWTNFYRQTKDLYKEVCKFLGSEIAVIYEQEK